MAQGFPEGEGRAALSAASIEMTKRPREGILLGTLRMDGLQIGHFGGGHHEDLAGAPVDVDQTSPEAAEPMRLLPERSTVNSSPALQAMA